jgi:hypothetical protein
MRAMGEELRVRLAAQPEPETPPQPLAAAQEQEP